MKLGKAFELTENNLNNLPTKIGVYIFGKMYKPKNSQVKKFKPMYVGRSDENLKIEVKQQYRNYSDKGITHFKYVEKRKAKTAFELECRLYHEFGKSKKLLNQIHPARPKPKKDYLKCTELGCNGED